MSTASEPGPVPEPVALELSGAEDGVARALRRCLDGPSGIPSAMSTAQDPVAVWIADRTAPDAAAASRWARAAVEAGRRRLILVASAEIHPASHRHPGLVDEDAVPGRLPEGGKAAAWQALEDAVRGAVAEALSAKDLSAEALSSEDLSSEDLIELLVLRPTILTAADGEDLWSRLVRGRVGRVVFVPAGFDPSVQWLAVEEPADILRRLAALPSSRLIDAARREGAAWVLTLHVAPDGAGSLRRAPKARGLRPIGLPSSLLRRLLKRGPAADAVDYLRYPWTVDGGRLRRLLASTATDEPPTSEDPVEDPLGFDKAYVDRLGKTFFRFLHDAYWRVEWRGLEHVPTDGNGVLVGVHRGHQPWDGVMVLHHLARTLGRYPRFLMHPTLVKHPFLAPYMTKCGGIHACRRNGDRVLGAGELLAIFPEGIRGAFSYYRDAYELKAFGRYDFVRFALRHRAPIVPFVIVGSAEIFPILGKIRWPWWQRVSEWPCLPITPTASLWPLPSKWHVLVLPAIPTAAEGPDAADDPRRVRELGERVKNQMQDALTELRRRRKHIFYGSIFDHVPPDAEWTSPEAPP